LAGIIVTQVANVFTCRSPALSITTLGLFSNRLVLVGVAAELALAVLIIYTHPGNYIFGCSPIGTSVWLLLLPFALLLLAADEVRKYIARRAGG
ncbi:MAG: cation-translocating P-type ATPase C-terminal domain-containing protein, partial [Desulfuromonadaceae bacterium]